MNFDDTPIKITIKSPKQNCLTYFPAKNLGQMFKQQEGVIFRKKSQHHMQILQDAGNDT